MTVTFRGGRLPNDPAKPRLKLGQFLSLAAVTPPATADWHSRVTSWPMFLNDQLGDCTCADLGHTLQQTALYGDGAEVRVTEDDILIAYKAVSGYNGDPSTDNGAVIQDVMGYWRKTGVAGHRSLAFAEVKVSNLNEVKAAISIFGAVHFGLQFPAFAMDQFNSGQPWILSTQNAGIEGGHDVVGVGYDSTYLYVVTWGAVQKVAWSFFAKYFEEGWIAVIPEWVNDQSGQTPGGLDLHGLGEQLAALTGEPNPFPNQPPNPPEPPPRPSALETAARALVSDQTVVAWSLGHHLGTTKRVAALIRSLIKAAG